MRSLVLLSMLALFAANLTEDPLERIIDKSGRSVQEMPQLRCFLWINGEVEAGDGLVIRSVHTFGPASRISTDHSWRQELKPGDVILEVNGRVITSLQDYVEGINATDRTEGGMGAMLWVRSGEDDGTVFWAFVMPEGMPAFLAPFPW